MTHPPETLFSMRDMALNALDYGVLITDEKGGIRFANDVFLSITGFDRSEVMHHSCRMLQGPLTDPHTLDALRQAQQAAVEFACEIINYRKDCRTFRNSLTVSPIRNHKGAVSHFVGIVRDMTRTNASADEKSITIQRS